MKCYKVVAAIIEYEDNILCMQRGKSKYDYISYKYEFPGGKVEIDESNEEALIREIQEELDLEIVVDRFFMTVNHKYADFEIIMHSYICTTKTKIINLKEHIDYKWLNINNFISLNWAEADIPIVNKLENSIL